MTRKSVLSVNAGSSSVKLTFYTFEKTPQVIAAAQVSGITAPPAKLKYTSGSTQHNEELKDSLNTPQDAFKFLLHRCISDPELSEVASTDDLAYICHRVVHGGNYESSVVITDETLHHLEKLEDLAPLCVRTTCHPHAIVSDTTQTQLLRAGNHPSLQKGDSIRQEHHLL